MLDFDFGSLLADLDRKESETAAAGAHIAAPTGFGGSRLDANPAVPQCPVAEPTVGIPPAPRRQREQVVGPSDWPEDEERYRDERHRSWLE